MVKFRCVMRFLGSKSILLNYLVEICLTYASIYF